MSTVNVGCKIPNGIIAEMGDKRVLLRGSNSSVVIGGHGITENVDADFFAAWREKNKELPFVKLGLVFAHEKPQAVAAQAKERVDELTGLEPLSPDAKPAGLTEVA